jgi:hypothetical protein
MAGELAGLELAGAGSASASASASASELHPAYQRTR